MHVCKFNHPLLFLLCTFASLTIIVEESSHKKLENMSEVDDQSSKVLCGVSGDCTVDADDESIEATPSSVPPMDDLLSECLYVAIKSSIKKEDLPILTSTFYRAHMKPLW